MTVKLLPEINDIFTFGKHRRVKKTGRNEGHQLSLVHLDKATLLAVTEEFSKVFVVVAF